MYVRPLFNEMIPWVNKVSTILLSHDFRRDKKTQVLREADKEAPRIAKHVKFHSAA